MKSLGSIPAGMPTLNVVQAGGYTWRICDPFSADEPWLRAPEEFLRDNDKLLKQPADGSTDRVVRVPTPTGNVVLKGYRPQGLRDIFKSCLRGASAMRALLIFLRLQELGIPALRPIAAGHRAGRPWNSVLITREVAEAQPLSA